MVVYDSINLNKEDTVRLNEISEENRYKYYSALDQYYEEYGQDPFWWLLPLSVRNENYDDTYFKICLILLILEKTSGGKYESVISDKKEVLSVLNTIYNSLDLKIRVILKDESSVEPLIHKVVRPIIRFYYRIKYVINLIRVCHIEKSFPRIKTDSIDILVWGALVLDKIEDGVYKDGYFPGLNEFCDKKFYYYPEMVYNTEEKTKKIVDRVNGFETYDLVFMSHYLRWYDILFCLRYRRYCCKLRRKNFEFDGYDITPLINASINKEIKRTDYSYAAMYYLATKRLAKMIPIRKMILWYEARPVDIAISLAIRDSDQNTIRIGYIGYPLAECMLGQATTKSQAINLVAPEIISVPGRVYESVIKAYYPEQKTIIAPAFRVRTTVGKKKKHNKTTVLFLALSYYPTISCTMISIVNKYCKNMRSTDLQVYIKMHPLLAGSRVSDFYDEKLCFEPIYLDGNIYECLKEADIAFTAASASSMDVIASGTYLICLCSKGQLYYTSIAPGVGGDRYSIIFDEKDFEIAMKKGHEFIKRSDKSKLRIDDYFIPVNKENAKILFE